MILGFTGTREGMDRSQADQFTRLILDLRPSEFHFGDCVGADAGAFGLIRAHLPECKTVAHPPTTDTMRAWCDADIVLHPELYAVRNEYIANACHHLAAAPLEPHEVLRSGTWMTVRMARRRGIPVHLLLRTV